MRSIAISFPFELALVDAVQRLCYDSRHGETA